MHTTDPKILIYDAEPIASERRRRGVTQKKIADAVGYTRQQVNRAERGKSASFVLIRRLCKELEVPLSEVIPELAQNAS